jgi:RNA polymerase sigma-70 factor (ECF subfamily)
LAGTLVLDASRADDLVQQTVLAALESAPARVARPRAWLAKVACNFARRERDADSRRIARERLTSASESVQATDEVVANAELQVEMANAVVALPEPYRTTLLLRFFEDLRPRAIGDRMGVPVETVKTRLQRGLELVREEIVGSSVRATRIEQIVALVPMLDRTAVSAVRRGLIAAAKAGAVGGKSGALATAAASSGAATKGWLGVSMMIAKLKLIAAAMVVIGGVLVCWRVTSKGPVAHAPSSRPTEVSGGARPGERPGGVPLSGASITASRMPTASASDEKAANDRGTNAESGEGAETATVDAIKARLDRLEVSFLTDAPDHLALNQFVTDVVAAMTIKTESVKVDKFGNLSANVEIAGSSLRGKLVTEGTSSRIEFNRERTDDPQYHGSLFSLGWSEKDGKLGGSATIQLNPKLEWVVSRDAPDPSIVGWNVSTDEHDTLLEAILAKPDGRGGMSVGYLNRAKGNKREPPLDLASYRILRDEVGTLRRQ